MKNKRELIEFHKKKYSSYENILDFYEKIIEEQEAIKPTLNVTPPLIRKELLSSLIKEGFPILAKKDFTLDVSCSAKLFKSICKLWKNANEKMKDTVQAIEDAITNKKLDVKELFTNSFDESFIGKVAGNIGTDTSILNFLIYMSIFPSLYENVEKLQEQIDLKNWSKGYCPICSSPPKISVLMSLGKRHYLCSFCGFQWPAERMKCPFCENTDHKKLQYFFAEGQEAYRVDACDNCHQYIKTVDSRKLDYEPDLHVEDIVTIHLDIVASEKGYKKPTPNVWGT